MIGSLLKQGNTLSKEEVLEKREKSILLYVLNNIPKDGCLDVLKVWKNSLEYKITISENESHKQLYEEQTAILDDTIKLIEGKMSSEEDKEFCLNYLRHWKASLKEKKEKTQVRSLIKEYESNILYLTKAIKLIKEIQ